MISVYKGSQSGQELQAGLEAGADAETTRMLLAGLLPTACSAYSLIPPSTTCLGRCHPSGLGPPITTTNEANSLQLGMVAYTGLALQRQRHAQRFVYLVIQNPVNIDNINPQTKTLTFNGRVHE